LTSLASFVAAFVAHVVSLPLHKTSWGKNKNKNDKRKVTK